MNEIGIDISGVQDVTVASEDWAFVVVKTTENLSVVNPKADDQWSAIKPHVRRGLYHYARPGLASAHQQADAFCDDALARGFMPGPDMWQLDCEKLLNEGVAPDVWERFVNEFMERALSRIGHLGFMYLGRDLLPVDVTARLTAAFNWWLPDYNVNDGTRHALPVDVNPVIHQFTSVNPALDRNVIHDSVTWQQLTNTDPSSATSTVPEEQKLILVPRLAVPTLPVPPGRVAHIRFDRESKTLSSLGYDFVRTTPGWNFSEGFGLLFAELTAPTLGANVDLDFDETRDGRNIFVAAKADFGTFKLPYSKVMAIPAP